MITSIKYDKNSDLMRVVFRDDRMVLELKFIQPPRDWKPNAVFFYGSGLTVLVNEEYVDPKSFEGRILEAPLEFEYVHSNNTTTCRIAVTPIEYMAWLSE